MAENNVNLEDLTTEKERLLSDRKVLVDRLQELQTSSEQIKTQVQAIGGAIQTCEYFINKLQPPQEPEETKVENSDEEDDS